MHKRVRPILLSLILTLIAGGGIPVHGHRIVSAQAPAPVPAPAPDAPASTSAAPPVNTRTASADLQIVDLTGPSGPFEYAQNINEAGQIVGVSGEPTLHQWQIAFWTAAGGGRNWSGGDLSVGENPTIDINEVGQVVGTREYDSRAFLLTSTGGKVDLGTLGGDVSSANDINDAGQVVGWSFTASYEPHGFIWTAAKGMQDLSSLGSRISKPVAINNAGQVVGTGSTADGKSHAFLWSAAGGSRDLGTLEGTNNSTPVAINEAGQVIGNSTTAKGESHAFLWTAATGMRDLGTLGGPNTFAIDINEAGEVIGNSETATRTVHAFLWTAATGMRDLGTLGGYESQATDINDAGQVVGESGTASGKQHAFLWTAATGMRDLGTLGGDYIYSGARHINNVGQVVGFSGTDEGQQHAVLWTPQPAPLVVVDPFSRTTSDGWGDALLGGIYSVSGLATYYAVDGQLGIGIMILPPGISGAAFLPAVSTHEADARVRVATDKRAIGGSLSADLALRCASDASAYRARLRFTPSGAVQLQAVRAVNNVETALGTPVTVPNVTHTPNSFVWLRVQATGGNPTTLRLKAWADGQTEPAAWQLTLTDSTAVLQGAGSVGLRASVPATTTNGPIRFSFDDFRVGVATEAADGGRVYLPTIIKAR